MAFILTHNDGQICPFRLLKVKKPTDGNIPCTTFGEHEIWTGDAKPVKRQQYRCPYALREEMRRQLDEMTDRGVITEAISDWSASWELSRTVTSANRCRWTACPGSHVAVGSNTREPGAPATAAIGNAEAGPWPGWWNM